MLLYFLCSVDELILNHQLENNFSKAVFKYPVPLGHLELPSLRQALCVRQGCWATWLLTLILELYPPVVGCESLPLALPNVIFKPSSLAKPSVLLAQQLSPCSSRCVPGRCSRLLRAQVWCAPASEPRGCLAPRSRSQILEAVACKEHVFAEPRWWE